MAKVYVGTYKKYNSGNLKGVWLNLDNYSTYAEFLNACKEAHKDEADPEYMIQDTEGFPDGLKIESWLYEEDFEDVKKAEQEKSRYTIVDYSDKAIAVIGDTKAIKDQLKKLGGRFNGKLSCGAGWIFPKAKRAAVEDLLENGNVEVVNTKIDTRFTDWLQEYIDTYCNTPSSKQYTKEAYVGAIKINEHYMLIRKESIENRFYFHDEGPNYDLYCSLSNDDEKLKEYFIKYNERSYTAAIKNIQNHYIYICYEDNHTCYIKHTRWSDNDVVLQATAEEEKLIIEGYAFAIQKLDKRLLTYLKRYGTSKIILDTYWADR
jgi:hypothetical protein